MPYTDYKPFSHKQTVAADTWNINHGAGFYPVVDIMVEVDGAMQKILPKELINVDKNNITIKFTRPFVGEARLC